MGRAPPLARPRQVPHLARCDDRSDRLWLVPRPPGRSPKCRRLIVVLSFVRRSVPGGFAGKAHVHGGTLSSLTGRSFPGLAGNLARVRACASDGQRSSSWFSSAAGTRITGGSGALQRANGVLPTSIVRGLVLSRSYETVWNRQVACPAGLEPATPSLEGWCSIQLSYGQLGLVWARWSGRHDSNVRPSGPKPDALPSCATPRRACILVAMSGHALQAAPGAGNSN